MPDSGSSVKNPIQVRWNLLLLLRRIAATVEEAPFYEGLPRLLRIELVDVSNNHDFPEGITYDWEKGFFYTGVWAQKWAQKWAQTKPK